MNGNVIQISDNRDKGQADEGRVIDAIDMHIKRLDLEERRQGLRGIDEHLRVLRSVKLRFEGFGERNSPASDLPVLGREALVAFGRSRTRADGGDGDVRLLISEDGTTIDEDASLRISRRHFDLYVENDRLILRVNGSNGLRVNGQSHGPDKTVVVADGDVIEPLVNEPDLLRIAVRFTRQHTEVSAVTLTRIPAIKGGES